VFQGHVIVMLSTALLPSLDSFIKKSTTDST